MHEEVEYKERTPEFLPWCWVMRGCDGVLSLMLFDDDDVLEPEGAEQVEEEG